MKRVRSSKPLRYSRHDEVAIRLPRRLILIKDDRNNSFNTFLFQPYLAEECGRLIAALRKEDTNGEVADAFRNVLCSQGRVSERHYKLLSQICLINTKRHRIGFGWRVDNKNIHFQGAIQVECVTIRANPIVDDSSFSESSSDDSSSLSTSSSSSSSSGDESSVSSVSSSFSSSEEEEEEPQRVYKKLKIFSNC